MRTHYSKGTGAEAAYRCSEPGRGPYGAPSNARSLPEYSVFLVGDPSKTKSGALAAIWPRPLVQGMCG